MKMRGKQLIGLLASVCLCSSVHATTINPSFDAYNVVAEHSCGADNSSRLEVVYLANRCGTLVSPCYPAHYPRGIANGARLWSLNYSQPIAGIRLTVTDFRTSGMEGVLYLGRTVKHTSGMQVVTGNYSMSGNLNDPANGSNPFKFSTNTSTVTRTPTNNLFTFSDVEPFFLSFYSSQGPPLGGFNISYCFDVDVCCADPTFCTNPSRGTCVRNNFEMYSCNCMIGFTAADCSVDIDECTPAPGLCDPMATCTNSPGSFSCLCPSGFTGGGIGVGACVDIDECTDGPNNCSSPGSNCTNLPGSFACSCLTGYTGNGITCTDIDECATNNGGCGDSATFRCTNLPGTSSCSCFTGFTNFPTCTDVDECTGSSSCNANATCMNIVGSFTCMCNHGFSGDGFTCTDINECTPTICDENATCTNTIGSFFCTCVAGYTGMGLPGQCDGYFCVENTFTETYCSTKGLIEWPSFYNGKTVYEINQDVTWFIHFSVKGVTGINFTIIEIDVQQEEDYIIFNDNSSYRSLTPVALFLTGEMDAVYNGSALASATNPVGYNVTTRSFVINRDRAYVHFHSDRSTVFTGFRISYEPAMHFCTERNPCRNGVTCGNDFVGYTCACTPGLTGRNCETDVNECVTSSPCDINADCANNMGSFGCSCRTNYIGDGYTCRPHIVISNPTASTDFSMTTGQTFITFTFDVTAMWRNRLDYIQNYNLTYTDSPGSINTVVSPLVNETNFNIIRFPVHSFSNYTINLLVGIVGPAFANARVTLPNVPVTVTSAENLPLPPTGLSVTATAIQTTLTWTAPVETGRGVTTGYQIGTIRSSASCTIFSVLGPQDDCSAETLYTISTENFATTMFVLTELIPYREYTFRVRARTSVGFGEWSTSVTGFTGNVCPSSVTEVGITPCPFTSGALITNNFPELYPRFHRSFWLFSHYTGGIRFTFDIFLTQTNQDFLDIGFGAIPTTVAPSDIQRQFSGNLGESEPTFVWNSSQTAGSAWARFESDIFTQNRGFLVIYETDIDSCLPTNPCLLGATCTDGVFDFTCTCPSLWTGKVCNMPLVTIVATCSSSASDSFTATWTNNRANDSSLFTMYTVTYTTSAGTITENRSIGTSQVTFSGFSPFQEYSVTVEVNLINPASRATTSTCNGRTQEAAPTAPTSPAVTSTSSSELGVTWNAPAKLNGVLSYYTVNYESTNHAEFGESVLSGSINVTTGTSGQIMGLRAFRTYQVTVTATTGGRTGPASAPVVQSTLTAVSSSGVRGLTVTPSATQVVINYSAPTPVIGNFSYVISYSATGVTPQTVTSSNLMQQITGLTPATEYTFQVFVSTSAGSGPSVPTSATTLEDIPGLVATPTFASTPDKITVIWSRPSDPNGIITSYRVVWKSGNSTRGSVLLRPATTTYTITNLTAGTEYTITVFASTTVGENRGTVATMQTSSGVAKVVVGVKPNTSVARSEIAGTTQSTFTIPNPLTKISSFFSGDIKSITSLDVIVREVGANPDSEITIYILAVNTTPIPPFWALTVVVNNRTGESKQGRTVDDQTNIVIGTETSCNATQAACNGPLLAGRSYEVAIRVGTPHGKSNLTAFSDPVKTLAVEEIEFTTGTTESAAVEINTQSVQIFSMVLFATFAIRYY